MKAGVLASVLLLCTIHLSTQRRAKNENKCFLSGTSVGPSRTLARLLPNISAGPISTMSAATTSTPSALMQSTLSRGQPTIVTNLNSVSPAISRHSVAQQSIAQAMMTPTGLPQTANLAQPNVANWPANFAQFPQNGGQCGAGGCGMNAFAQQPMVPQNGGQCRGGSCGMNPFAQQAMNVWAQQKASPCGSGGCGANVFAQQPISPCASGGCGGNAFAALAQQNADALAVQKALWKWRHKYRSHRSRHRSHGSSDHQSSHSRRSSHTSTHGSRGDPTIGESRRSSETSSQSSRHSRSSQLPVSPDGQSSHSRSQSSLQESLRRSSLPEPPLKSNSASKSSQKRSEPEPAVNPTADEMSSSDDDYYVPSKNGEDLKKASGNSIRVLASKSRTSDDSDKSEN